MNMDEKSILENKKVLKIIVFSIMFVVYILPSGIFTDYLKINLPIDKLIFSLIMVGIYIVDKIKVKKISKLELIFITIILLFCIMNRTIDYLLFLPILLLEKLIKNRNLITSILKTTKIDYVCLAFTIFYTILYKILGFVRTDRFAFSAIGEINQSGLAIFCLALILINKNKKVGIFTLIFGLLTISRSYFLAVGLYIISQFKCTKKIVAKIKNYKVFNFFILTIISSIVILIIGQFFIYQNSIGNVYWGDDANNRLINVLDYSNLFRFLTNIVVLMIYIKNPFKLLTGLSDVEFTEMGKKCYEMINVKYKFLNPHNLFFSHLRIYGIFSVFEIYYISRILTKIVNKNNLIVYLSIVLYSVLLGAGLYSYWLYLSCFVLIVLENDNKIKEGEMGIEDAK